MVTRHSKQIPMPHSGPRGSPLTDRRYPLMPAVATAVDTMVPAGTETGAPLTESVTESAMRLRMSTLAWGRLQPAAGFGRLSSMPDEFLGLRGATPAAFEAKETVSAADC
jgi:hypothetical protein